MNSVFARSTCPRFLIADDHAMFAETLRVYLEKTYTVLGVVLDGRALVAEAMRLRPDVIVADFSMPLLNGWMRRGRSKSRSPTSNSSS